VGLRAASMFALYKYSLDFDITVNIFTAKSSFGTDADGGGGGRAFRCYVSLKVRG